MFSALATELIAQAQAEEVRRNLESPEYRHRRVLALRKKEKPARTSTLRTRFFSWSREEESAFLTAQAGVVPGVHR